MTNCATAPPTLFVNTHDLNDSTSFALMVTEENINCSCCFPMETESGLRTEGGSGLQEPLVGQDRGGSGAGTSSWVQIEPMPVTHGHQAALGSCPAVELKSPCPTSSRSLAISASAFDVDLCQSWVMPSCSTGNPALTLQLCRLLPWWTVSLLLRYRDS